MFINWLKQTYQLTYNEFKTLTGWIKEQITLDYIRYSLEVSSND